MRNELLVAATVWMGCAGLAAAQQCAQGIRVEGTVVDSTGSAIAGAEITAGTSSVVSDGSGHFTLSCAAPGSAVTAQAATFHDAAATIPQHAGATSRMTIRMQPETVRTDVQVGNGAGASLDSDSGLGTHTLTQNQIAQLADDPDDMTRELQVLAAANGGAPGAARITVDGFQNASALPPKSSIARIVTAPDLYSAEYEEAPYGGGRVEIYTKPGATAYHGALFYTDSDGSFNATDPFSVTATPAGKRRYGFELTGPISKKTSDFNLALEKRDIDEFNVVNAIDLDAQGNQAPVQQTVSAPQRLWIASARGDWQANPKNIATLSFSANVNNEGNVGVGGLTLEDAGYGSEVSEYDLRLTDTWTISTRLLNDLHIGWTWKDTAETPNSNAPNLQVAGYFVGGGNTDGFLNNRERDLEIDDYLLYSHGKHQWKLGEQAFGNLVHEEEPNTFNGAYTFAGSTGPALDANGNATGPDEAIDALEQYRRALAGLAGGTPTTFEQTNGTALVPLAQWRLAAYVEDVYQYNSQVTLSGGLRYSLQSSPDSYANFAPRLGAAWAIDKKAKTVIHARTGIFNDPVDEGIALEAERLNGSRQMEHLVYSPSYTNPLTPVAGSLGIDTVRSLPASFKQTSSLQNMLGIEHDFPHHWHPQANFIYVEAWDIPLSRNINAPQVVSSNNAVPDLAAALAAPRPGAPNLNIFQYQETAHLSGPIIFLGLDQHSYKRFAFFAGYLDFNLTEDAPGKAGFVQNAYSNRGEKARPDWQAGQRFFFFGNYNFPWGVTLSSEMDVQGGLPYNVTTGTDNNGDGSFNDRPSYASTPGTDVYSTRFGLLTPNAINGDVPRNLGTMPALVHLDSNLSRTWNLGAKHAGTPLSLTLNARAANLLNHTNVTAVSSVVSSPTFAQSLAAEQARRVELGARFTF